MKRLFATATIVLSTVWASCFSSGALAKQCTMITPVTGVDGSTVTFEARCPAATPNGPTTPPTSSGAPATPAPPPLPVFITNETITAPDLVRPSTTKIATIVDIREDLTLTVLVDFTRVEVRLANITTPTSGTPLHQDAFYMLKALAPSSSIVYLDLNDGRRDAQGRLLGYIWQQRTLVNLALVEGGVAEAVDEPDGKYTKALLNGSAYAKNAKLGRWAEPK